MTAKVILDAGGASLKVTDYHGEFLQPFPHIGERVDDLPYLGVRDDDVILLGHPKSGNHWVWEIIARLITGEAGSNFSMYFGEFLVEGRPNEFLDKLPSPRIIASHLHPHHIGLAEKLFSGKHKVIYIARNPKDVAVSFYIQSHNFRTLYGYDGKWNNYFELFLDGKVDCGPWFDHVLRWEQFRDTHPHVPMHFVLYEDLHKDLMGEIQKLAAFLEINRDDNFYRNLYNVCLFPAMKKNHDAHAPDYIRTLYRNGDMSMFRKGIIGDWKNVFTVDQSERFDAVFVERMKGSKLKFRFDPDS